MSRDEVTSKVGAHDRAEARRRLTALQSALFGRIARGDVADDPWFAEHVRGFDPELVTTIVQRHHAENVEAKLETFFPVFARWAKLPRDFVRREFPENKTTGPRPAIIHHTFLAAYRAAGELEHAAIWRELLVIERAERLAELSRVATTAEYVSALKAIPGGTLDFGELGFVDHGPFTFVRVGSNLIDIHRAYDPRSATFFGPPRTVALWVPPATGVVEPRFFSTLRELSIELAFS
ncbi:hypothetical protein L6R52_23300 [Myxococcota bacterium]|nr:hypothetical protein [Myxococcota bacterium]